MAEYIDKQALITEIQSAVSMVLQTAPYEKVWFDRFVGYAEADTVINGGQAPQREDV